jgi:hypothetical protein
MSKKEENERVIFDLIINELVSSVRNEIAFGMHRHVHTGIISLSELRTVHRIPCNDKADETFASTDGEKDEPMNSTKTTATFSDSSSSVLLLLNKTVDAADMDGTDDTFPPAATATTTQPSSNILYNNSPITDIWGQVPSKEPKSMVLCEFCCKHIAPVRFSNHLDKCMTTGGVSTHSGTRFVKHKKR